MLKKKIPYILAYKSQNLRQNLDLKVGGSDLYAGHKVKNFLQPPKYAVSDRVEPRDSVLLCDVVPLRRGTRHLTCMALYSLLLMVSVTHQWSRRCSHAA